MTLNEYTVEEIKKIYDIVKQKRFLMLKGATGTGKTLYAHALACLLVDCGKEGALFGEETFYCGADGVTYDGVYHDVQIREKYNEYLGNGRVRNVIFHKATNRENFVYGISVSAKEKQLQFESRKRVFLEAVEAAMGDKNHAYVILLDDIGRADFSAVMGDLLSALESMGDGNTFQADQKYEIPQNLYIIATYNPAVAVGSVDYAWYRRFFVYELNPDERYIIKSKETVWKNNSIFALYDEKHEIRGDIKKYSNFRNMDDYQRFVDYVYVLFLHVKILFEKYSTDPDVRNLYIPGHGMFLTYVNGKSSEKNRSDFKKNIDTFHLQLRHVIVPLLYHCLHTGLLDQRAAFDIDLLEHLWEKGYGKITPMCKTKGAKRYEYDMIDQLIRVFPDTITYFFFLRNPLLMRKRDNPKLKRYFLFEKDREQYIDPNKNKKSCHLQGTNYISFVSSAGQDLMKIWSYDCLRGNETGNGEDYIDAPDVYAPPVFLALFKTAVKLLSIIQSQDVDKIWDDANNKSNGKQNESLDYFLGAYKNYQGIKNDKIGAKRLEYLHKAFLLLSDYANDQPNEYSPHEVEIACGWR